MEQCQLAEPPLDTPVEPKMKKKNKKIATPKKATSKKKSKKKPKGPTRPKFIYKKNRIIYKKGPHDKHGQKMSVRSLIKHAGADSLVKIFNKVKRH